MEVNKFNKYQNYGQNENCFSFSFLFIFYKYNKIVINLCK